MRPSTTIQTHTKYAFRLHFSMLRLRFPYLFIYFIETRISCGTWYSQWVLCTVHGTHHLFDQQIFHRNVFASCPCTVHETYKHFFSTKLLLKMNLMVLFTHLNFSFQFLILSKIKGCLVFFFVITLHSIFITHHSLLKIPKFSQPHPFGHCFQFTILKIFNFLWPHTCNLGQLL